jgi:hypothetical protein
MDREQRATIRPPQPTKPHSTPGPTLTDDKLFALASPVLGPTINSWSPKKSCQSQRRAHTLRQASGMASHQNCCSSVGWAGVASPRLSRELPHASPGHSQTTYAPGSVEDCPHAAVWTGCALVADVLVQRDRAHRIPQPTTDEGRREATDALVVSSLVSSVYVRLGSLAFESMRKYRSRTRALFGELLSQLLKIGRSVVQDR